MELVLKLGVKGRKVFISRRSFQSNGSLGWGGREVLWKALKKSNGSRCLSMLNKVLLFKWNQ